MKEIILITILLSSLTTVFSLENKNEIYPITDILDEDYRLPLSVIPSNYKLEFLTILDPEPGYQRFTAVGKVWITVDCKNQTSVITLHSANLTIDTTRVRNKASGIYEQINGISYNVENDFLHIELASMTQVEVEYEIYIEFIAPISEDRLNGMYLDFYDDPDSGERRNLATTLFAPYHTRRAFPCFDEPALRATYDISLGHHKKYHAMSNTEIIDTKPIDNMTDWQWDTFATTPSISSYITAMIVSDLEFEEASQGSFRNVSIRVYARPEAIKQGAGAYSAKLTGDVMTYFESLFIAKFPISKLYSIALPQFFFSAMENWGAITYKEPVLLYLPGETSEEERYKINYVLSHENAHQHFGNLIAVKFWTFVWLKEGFATYYSHYGINHTNPEFLPWEQFIPTILQVAMEFDSSNETHPLANFPTTSADVAGIYTDIPYEKGASILRMASSIVTEPVFLSGIQLYVDRFQYNNAEQDDVFQSLQESVDATPSIAALLPTSVKNILDTWTTKAGYPILRVNASNSDVLEISQEKYIDGDTSNPLDTWWVPVYLNPRPNSSLPENFPDVWIPENITTIRVNMSTEQLIILNPVSIGYYRVLYDNQSGILQRIVDQLDTDHTVIPPLARSQILNDYFHFSMSGYSNIETVLSLTKYLDRETNLAVWDSVLPKIEKISKLLINTEFHQDFQDYFGSKLWNALELLTAHLDKGATAILQSKLMKLACSLGNPDCLVESKHLLNQWMGNSSENRILVDIQEAVYCTGAEDENNWNFLHSQYKLNPLGTFSPHKIRLLKALICSKNHSHLKDLLDMIMSDTTGIDKSEILGYFVGNHIGKGLVLESLQNSMELISIFKSNKELDGFFKTLTSNLISDKEMKTMESLSSKLTPERQMILRNNLRQAEKTKKWFVNILQPLGNWLRLNAIN